MSAPKKLCTTVSKRKTLENIRLNNKIGNSLHGLILSKIGPNNMDHLLFKFNVHLFVSSHFSRIRL